jgi:hypothetical protein
LLQTALAALHKEGYELYRPQLSVTLAEGVAKTRERELAYSTICEAVTWAEIPAWLFLPAENFSTRTLL